MGGERAGGRKEVERGVELPSLAMRFDGRLNIHGSIHHSNVGNVTMGWKTRGERNKDMQMRSNSCVLSSPGQAQWAIVQERGKPYTSRDIRLKLQNRVLALPKLAPPRVFLFQLPDIARKSRHPLLSLS